MVQIGGGDGYIMSRVLLSIVFFLILFPISLVYRMFNKDTLQLKRKEGSYWTERDHKFTGDDLKQVW